MAVTQREWDIMQLEAKLRVNSIVSEWRQGFYGSRLQPQGFTQGQVPQQEIDGPDTVPPGAPTLPPAPPPQELRQSEVFGEQEIPELDEVEL
jgi:hypothetical protein